MRYNKSIDIGICTNHGKHGSDLVRSIELNCLMILNSVGRKSPIHVQFSVPTQLKAYCHPLVATHGVAESSTWDWQLATHSPTLVFGCT